jgi:biopolymer transport protein ExbD
MATVSYLDRLLDPLTEAFTPKVASALLELRADSELEAHIDELRRKAKDGSLTSDEESDYKDFVEAIDLISIMQAKARRFLAKQCA